MIQAILSATRLVGLVTRLHPRHQGQYLRLIPCRRRLQVVEMVLTTRRARQAVDLLWMSSPSGQLVPPGPTGLSRSKGRVNKITCWDRPTPISSRTCLRIMSPSSSSSSSSITSSTASAIISSFISIVALSFSNSFMMRWMPGRLSPRFIRPIAYVGAVNITRRIERKRRTRVAPRIASAICWLLRRVCIRRPTAWSWVRIW